MVSLARRNHRETAFPWVQKPPAIHALGMFLQGLCELPLPPQSTAKLTAPKTEWF